MASPSPHLPDYHSLYKKFRWDPNALDRNGNPLRPPMTMIDRDGSVLAEIAFFRLRSEIIERNDVATLERYLAIAPWVLHQNDELHWCSDTFYVAAQSGNIDALKVLLAHYSKIVDSPQTLDFRERGFLLLNAAAEAARVEMVQFLLENQPLYADIHARIDGYTALASAAGPSYSQEHDPFTWQGKRREAVMNMLLDWGACASDTFLPRYFPEREQSDTVLTLAAQWAGSELIKRLIIEGADVHAKVTQWVPQLNSFHNVDALAVASRYANPNAVETLLNFRGPEAGIADAGSSRDSRGTLPIHWVTQYRFPVETSDFTASQLQETLQRIITTIKLLLDNDPATINVQDNDGNTPLHHATETFGRTDKCFADISRLLCIRGADTSICNNKGQTPLHTLFSDRIATIPVDSAIILILLAHGARVTDIDANGDTPLHRAARQLYDIDAVSLLLEQGSDAAVRNSMQRTPLHEAARGRYKSNLRDTQLEQLTKAQDHMLAKLIEIGGIGLMEQPDAEGMTPLQICQEERNEVSKWDANDPWDASELEVTQW